MIYDKSLFDINVIALESQDGLLQVRLLELNFCKIWRF